MNTWQEGLGLVKRQAILGLVERQAILLGMCKNKCVELVDLQNTSKNYTEQIKAFYDYFRAPRAVSWQPRFVKHSNN